jgi:lycopene cyclase domain-containing protein
MTYLALLFICLLVGFLLQRRYKIHLYHSFKEELVFVLILLIIMIPMDIYAVAHGVWAFPGDGILGVHIFNLPIEEYLFVLVVPYFVLIMYKTILKKVR